MKNRWGCQHCSFRLLNDEKTLEICPRCLSRTGKRIELTLEEVED